MKDTIELNIEDAREIRRLLDYCGGLLGKGGMKAAMLDEAKRLITDAITKATEPDTLTIRKCEVEK